MLGCKDELRRTLRAGQRRQDPLNPQKYRYSHPFRGLAYDNTHVVVIVLFRFEEDESGRPMRNNHVVTAFQKEIGAEPQIRCDEPTDTLHVSFAPGEGATGVELNANLLLRIDKRTRRPVGLTIFNYSLLPRPGDGDRPAHRARRSTRRDARPGARHSPEPAGQRVPSALRVLPRDAGGDPDRPPPPRPHHLARGVSARGTKRRKASARAPFRVSGSRVDVRGTRCAGTLDASGALSWQTMHARAKMLCTLSYGEAR